MKTILFFLALFFQNETVAPIDYDATNIKHAPVSTAPAPAINETHNSRLPVPTAVAYTAKTQAYIYLRK